MINALKGTMMGRKVQSVEQVLEEAKGWTETDSGLETSVQEPTQGSMRPLEFFGPHPDRFKFRAISLGPKVSVITLTDLETSEGTWSDIAIHDRFGSGTLLAQRDYIQISEGTHNYYNGQFQPLREHVSPILRLLPLRVQYWFLRAAWQRYNATGPDSTEGFVKSFYAEYLSGGIHHAEQIRWIDAGYGKYDALLYTQGWEKDHPFSQVRGLNTIPLDCQIISLNSGEPYLPTLTSWLFDDPDPIRVSNVFGYAVGSPNSVVNIRINTPTSGDNYSIDIEPNGLCINLTGNPAPQFRARGLYAPKTMFTPWVKP